MIHRTQLPLVLLAATFLLPASALAQARNSEPQRGTAPPSKGAPPQTAPTPAQRGATPPAPATPPTPATPAQRGATPQRGQRAGTPAKAPSPMTLRQVVEALISSKNSARVEDQISKNGVRFQSTPAVLELLKEFGASPKLLSMIPAAPAAAAPTPAKTAGPLTVVCEPRDCAVAVNGQFKRTAQNRATLTELPPGEANLEVFADGYETVSRKLQLEEGKPLEEKITLKRNTQMLQQTASASLMRTLASIGGVDGLAELADIEGSGTMEWMSSAGTMEEWPLTFSKRVGKDVTVTFKTKDGQCVATIQGQTTKQDCRGSLKNSGEKVAEQATSLFLSYQVQDVLQALLRRPITVAEGDDNRLESADAKDAYVLIIGNDSLPAGLIYRIADGNAPIEVRYSEYLKVLDARYPGKISIGRLNSAPVWVFKLDMVRSKVGGKR